MKNTTPLHPKVALITGSTSGIGLAIAKLFVREGIAVVINSLHSKQKGEELAAELPNTFYYQADVAKENECQNLVRATLERFGQLDILINNAASASKVVSHSDLAAATDELFQNNLAINLYGPWYLSRAALPFLKQSGQGTIINISSVAGIRPGGSSIPYAVSKAALNHLTLLLAKVAAPEVRVNAIAPGFVETPRHITQANNLLREAAIKKSLLKRVCTPEVIADMVLAMCRCDYMTGEIVVVDGGVTLA